MVAAQATGRSLRDWKISRFKGPAPARRWLIEGLIPAGTVGVFAAVGDAGKSMLALRLAYMVGCYQPLRVGDIDVSAPRFFGQPVTARGAAVVLTAEDDADEVHRRLAALDKANLRDNADNVFVRPMLSDGGPRAILADGYNGPEPTPFWHELRAELLQIPDLKLVVLDPLAHFVAASIDKDNRAAGALMAMLGGLAAETGATVMLIHHMSKATVPTSLTDARTAVRGAGALVDNGRWALAMWEADKDDAYRALKALGQKERAEQAGVVYLGGLAKGNAPGAKILRTLVRDLETGILEDVTDAIRAGTPRQFEADDAAYEALCAARFKDERFAFTGGERGLYALWHPAFKAHGLRVSRRHMRAIFERLKDRGLIIKTEGKKDGNPMYEPRI